MKTISQMDKSIVNALIPPTKGSIAVLSPRSQCDCDVTATYRQYGMGWWLVDAVVILHLNRQPPPQLQSHYTFVTVGL